MRLVQSLNFSITLFLTQSRSKAEMPPQELLQVGCMGTLGKTLIQLESSYLKHKSRFQRLILPQWEQTLLLSGQSCFAVTLDKTAPGAQHLLWLLSQMCVHSVVAPSFLHRIFHHFNLTSHNPAPLLPLITWAPWRCPWLLSPAVCCSQHVAIIDMQPWDDLVTLPCFYLLCLQAGI